MKPRLRLFFVLLISLMLSVNGMAAPELASERCLMTGSEMTTAAREDHQAHGNMLGMNTAGVTEHSHNDDGPLCASGQQCQTSSMLSPEVSKPALPGAPLIVATYFPDYMPTTAGDSHWRPPGF